MQNAKNCDYNMRFSEYNLSICLLTILLSTFFVVPEKPDKLDKFQIEIKECFKSVEFTGQNDEKVGQRLISF